MYGPLRFAYFAGLVFCSPAVAAPPDCTYFNNNGRLDTHDRRWCQALAIKEKYLEGGKFVKKIPSGHDGKARDVRSRLSTSFSNSGSSSVSGTVSIGELQGFFRLNLASTDNTLYYGRKIRVSGTVSTSRGRLEIYSPVNTNLWEMAAVLVDNPDRKAPPPEDGLVLEGYVLTEIATGPAQGFSATLLPIGDRFVLLLNAPDGSVEDIRIEIDGS